MPPANGKAVATGTRDISIAIDSPDELMKLANILYLGGGQAMGFDRPEKVAAAILCGAEVGLKPTQALNSIMMTNGRMTIYGDGALALVRANAVFESIREYVIGQGDDRVGHCHVKRKGEDEKEFKFSMRQAIDAGLIKRALGKEGAKGVGPWISYPERMLVMRARGYALRDVFPDVLRGLMTAEEAQDIQTAEVNVVSVTANTNAEKPKDTTSAASQATGQSRTPELPAKTESATSTPSSASPTPEPPKEKATEEQLLAIKELYKNMMVGRGLREPNECKAAWEQVLAPYGVTSARELTVGQSAELIAKLSVDHDPFSSHASLPAKT